MGRPFSWSGLHRERNYLLSEADPASRMLCHPVRRQGGFSQSRWMGLRNGIQWTDIEVENDTLGKPIFSFHRKAKEVCETLRIQNALLTLSHDRPYAVAHVLLEEGNHESSDR